MQKPFQKKNFKMATVKAFNQLYDSKESMLEVLMGNIHKVVDTSGGSLKAIEARLEDLQQQLLKKTNSKQSYDKLANEIYELREKKQNVMVKAPKKMISKSESASWKISFRDFNLNLRNMTSSWYELISKR